MRKATLLNNSFRFIVALFLVGVLIFQNSTQSEKATALADTSDDVVTHMAKERNISVEEAQVRIGWQNKAGVLEKKLKEVLPASDFGGVWINKTNDKVNIGIVNESDTADASRQAIINEIKTAGISEGADTIPVKHSFSELTKTTEAILKLYKESVGRKEWPIQMGIKTDLNKVQVDIPANNKNLSDNHRFVISEIENKYKDQVFFETYDEPPVNQAECNWWFCNSPLRGGVGINGNYDNFESTDCTGGFIVRGNASGNLYLLTAGHCYEAGYGWGTKTYNYTQKLIGSITMSLFTDPSYNQPLPIDAMIVDIKEDVYGWSVMGKILKRSGDHIMNGQNPPQYSEEYDIQTYTSNVVNERICISPAITGGWPSDPNGGSCGLVHEVNKYVTTVNDGITTQVHRAGYCSRGGDSGSPIFASQNDAKGIHRAGTPDSICANDKYYTPMSLIINRFNSVGSPISIY